MLFKKPLSILLIVASIINATEIENLQVGIVPFITNTPYKGAANEVYLLPILILQYGNLYVEGINVGYSLYTKNNLQLNALIEPSVMGYKSSDSEFLEGMENREYDVGTGLEISYKFEVNTITTKLMYDFFSKHNGYSFDIKYSRDFILNEKNIITPYIGMEYLSSKKSTYYYGVPKNESNTQRSSYELGGNIHQYFGVDILHLIDERWSIVGNIAYTHLNEEIVASPIVDRKYLLSSYIGVLYAF